MALKRHYLPLPQIDWISNEYSIAPSPNCVACFELLTLANYPSYIFILYHIYVYTYTTYIYPYLYLMSLYLPTYLTNSIIQLLQIYPKTTCRTCRKFTIIMNPLIVLLKYYWIRPSRTLWMQLTYHKNTQIVSVLLYITLFSIPLVLGQKLHWILSISSYLCSISNSVNILHLSHFHPS